MAQSTTHGAIVGRELHDDAFRRDWERLELARVVAATVVAHRSDNDLSQRDLADRLGVPQSQVARIENATVNPSNRTLMLLAGELGIEFNISIVPAGRAPRLVARRVYERATVVDQAAQAAMRFAVGGP